MVAERPANSQNGAMILYRPRPTTWPKVPPALSREQLAAREKYMLLWHQQLPQKYGAVEKFNHGFAARLLLPTPCRTLEIGAGLGEHAAYEDLTRQQYHFLEYREEFCKALKGRYPNSPVILGDIHERQAYPDAHFDRIVAIHVLEHLVDLPAAVAEIGRLLKDEGVFDIVIPCEGGFAHSLGRKLTAQRLFEKNFKMDFTPIRQNEHVSTFREILTVLERDFRVRKQSFFPAVLPYYQFNFCAGFRLHKRLDK
jgi:SAM-dependent methyltransferase